nr:immunoglobulin light chain junction region [Macaca mulatta]MOW58318.1 immunoglobulin light chain junction region [Macaca mulatta]MOW61382.1 immunoglobulin light chain junction region [Macaca mulatta]
DYYCCSYRSGSILLF